MNAIIPEEGKPIKCDECEDIVTREDVKKGRKQLYSRQGRYLCELCTEDEIENEMGDRV